MTLKFLIIIVKVLHHVLYLVLTASVPNINHSIQEVILFSLKVWNMQNGISIKGLMCVIVMKIKNKTKLQSLCVFRPAFILKLWT